MKTKRSATKLTWCDRNLFMKVSYSIVDFRKITTTKKDILQQIKIVS